MSNNIETLTEQISKLTLLEAADLAKSLEDKLGVSPMAMAMPAGGAAAAGADAADAAPAKDDFDVVITAVGEKKLNVIKAIREIIPGSSLVEVKGMLDELPKAILSGASKEDADKAKTVLEGAGATVELK